MSASSSHPDVLSVFDASWLQEASAGLDPASRAQIEHAATWATPLFGDQVAATGELLLSHGAGTVRILADLHADQATRIAALLAALPTDVSVAPGVA